MIITMGILALHYLNLRYAWKWETPANNNKLHMVTYEVKWSIHKIPAKYFLQKWIQGQEIIQILKLAHVSCLSYPSL